MKEKKTYDRKFFLKIASFSMTLFSIGFIFPLIDKFRTFSISRKNIELSDVISDGINFFSNFIIIKNSENIKILSSKCTHLGCIIKNRDSNGNLVCSCHGSVFSPDGRVLAGPASSDLNELKWHKNSKTGKIIIEDVSV